MAFAECDGEVSPKGAHLDRIEDKVGLVAFDEVPGVGLQLVPDRSSEALRPNRDNPLFTPDIHAQQPVEADEMIHVHVRDKYQGNAQQGAGAKGGKIAQIEEQGFRSVQRLDVDGWISETPVDQSRMKRRAHAATCWSGQRGWDLLRLEGQDRSRRRLQRRQDHCRTRRRPSTARYRDWASGLCGAWD